MPEQHLNRETIEEKVLTIVQTKKRLASDVVTLDSTFVDLGIDSLDGMDLIFEFEDAFNISISTETAATLKSVRQVVDALDGMLNHPTTTAN